jgi:hypothetical protein
MCCFGDMMGQMDFDDFIYTDCNYYSFVGISLSFNTILGLTFCKKFMTDILNSLLFFFLYVCFVEFSLIQFAPEDGHIGLKHVEVLTTCIQHKKIN